MAKHLETGRYGETLAVEYLIAKGYSILAQNYRYQKSEVDIISRYGNITIFIEVKTRSTDAFGYPEMAVTKAKQRLLKIAMDYYIHQNKIETGVRFDIISITLGKMSPEIHHIEDAFFH